MLEIASRRRVLIVSPHFPPTNAPDHQRVRMSLPYFREFGWEPTVLAVDAANIEGALDPLLADALPADVPVHRVGAWPAALTRLVGLGNIAYRAWRQLDSTGARLLRESKFDLVYFSTTQFVATALGPRWRKKFGVPYIVDIQDPWRTDYYERLGAPPPPGGWKYRFARWQAARLEESSWREAAGFISVSPAYLEQLRARYAWFVRKPAAVIPFGASEADFEFARSRAGVVAAFGREPGAVHVVSVGAIGPIMRPALETFLDGLAAWKSRRTDVATRLRVHFIGTSYAPTGRATPSVQPLADARGLGEIVREQTSRVGYFSALRSMTDADALVLPGSNDPGYSPSKISACVLARRPVLAVVPEASAAADRIRTLHFADVVTTGSADADDRVGIFLDSLFARAHARGPQAPRATDFDRSVTARACTGRQCALFEEALGSAS